MNRSPSVTLPLLDSARTDVVFVEKNRVVDVIERSAGRSSDEAGVADYDRAVRNVEVDICAGRDKNVVADPDITYDDGICANPYVITDMRRTLSLTSELGSDDYAGRYVDVMADNALRVDDYTAEMRKIKALADIRVIRDLEMILTAQSVESEISYCKLNLIELFLDAVPLLDLVSIVTRTSHYADIAEFRG